MKYFQIDAFLIICDPKQVIPIPGTGAWTGTLAASILDMDFKSTIAAVMLGVLLAGIIMMVLSLVGVSIF